MYGTLCKLRIPRLGGLVITTFNMVLGGLELLALLLLGHIPAVGALYRSLGLDIFADVPFFAGFTLRSLRCCCARRHLLPPPSAFCSPPRSRNTPPRPRPPSSI